MVLYQSCIVINLKCTILVHEKHFVVIVNPVHDTKLYEVKYKLLLISIIH